MFPQRRKLNNRQRLSGDSANSADHVQHHDFNDHHHNNHHTKTYHHVYYHHHDDSKTHHHIDSQTQIPPILRKTNDLFYNHTKNSEKTRLLPAKTVQSKTGDQHEETVTTLRTSQSRTYS